MWHMHVRQVPLRHERGKRRPSKLAASRIVSESGASNVRPDGSTLTRKTWESREPWDEGEEFSDIVPAVRSEARSRLQLRLRERHA